MAISINYTGDSYENSLMYITDAISTVGVTMDEATEAISRVSQLMRDLECINARIDWLEEKVVQLESVPDVKTENPNQKSDLEIFNRIVPSEEFLKLEGNMFLN